MLAPATLVAHRALARDRKEVNLMSVPLQIRLIIDHFFLDEDGQGLAEYALILALIAVVAIASLLFLGNQVSTKMNVIGSTLQSVAP
jgi:pilus assembly protein Flp/PilA